MGRVYSGRNSQNLSVYAQVRENLRGRTDLTQDQLTVIAMYARAAGDEGKAGAYRAAVVEHIGRLSAPERATVNSILAEAGAEGIS